MAWWIPLAASVIGGIMTNKAGKRNIRMAREDAAKAFAEQQKQQKLLAGQMDEYKSQSFSNPYAENVFEDLTVNQKQAQFQSQQGNQQRSDLLQNLKGAAGGSGIAGLAQSLANQGVLQTQRISASIGQQESANQRAAAQGQLRVQQGEEMLQNKNADMQSTLLGMQYGQATGANQNYQQMQQNVYGARSSAAAANADAVQGVVSTVSNTTFPTFNKQSGKFEGGSYNSG
tara:strand:+ start:2147 stop:2836 length:690 start_codon:yes stop_codon:yes gene_type:complete